MYIKLNTRLILITLPLFLAGCSTPDKHAASEPSIVVTIPCNSDGRRDVYIDIQPRESFYVLLTNTGKRPVKLWDEVDSWGYYSLQLEVIGPDGQKHLLKKKPIDFLSNGPGRSVVQPGEAVIWDVIWETKVWENLSWIPEGQHLKAQIRAIYNAEPDVEYGSADVWTGHATSKWYDVNIYRYKKPEGK